jgi:hypothetical protein
MLCGDFFIGEDFFKGDITFAQGFLHDFFIIGNSLRGTSLHKDFFDYIITIMQYYWKYPASQKYFYHVNGTKMGLILKA